MDGEERCVVSHRFRVEGWVGRRRGRVAETRGGAWWDREIRGKGAGVLRSLNFRVVRGTAGMRLDPNSWPFLDPWHVRSVRRIRMVKVYSQVSTARTKGGKGNRGYGDLER